MKNKSLKDKSNRYAEFVKTGDIEQVKLTTSPIEEDRDIIFDGVQYSCKIPKNFMIFIGHKKGDKLRFKVVHPKDKLKKPHLEISYIQNGSKNS